MQVLKPLVYSFLENADKAAWLVLLVPEGDAPGIPEEFKERQALFSLPLPYIYLT